MELPRSPSLRIGIRLQNHMHTAVADRDSGRGEGGADGAGHVGSTGSRSNEYDLRDEQLDLYGGLDAKESMMMAELNCTRTGSDATGSCAVGVARKEIELTRDEKQYLMSVERGDVPTARKWLQEAQIHYGINVNCVDALGRTALVIAIENDNVEMIELLLTFKVDVGDALLHAINEGNVEATLMLLHVTDTQRRQTNASPLDCPANKEKAAKITAKWKRLTRSDKSVDAEDASAADTLLLEASSLRCSSSFTPDITPLILAAHRDHYEIIKILLERGDRIEKPHDVQCGCAQCVVQSSEDSLNHSRSRINAYRALASPSLIALSSRDPILTAFKLSWELRLLSRLENELKVEYEQLAKQCQDFAVDLLDQTRGSKELEVLLNYDSDGLVSDSIDSGVVKDGMSLARLKLAIKYKQKKFVSHASCQQLLASLWYEGLLGFRRRHILFKILLTVSVFVLYPVLSCIYMIAPKSSIGRFMRRPFIKFICHSASYLTFLFLLILASQRIESITNLALSGHNEAKMTREVRGAPPTSIEWMILAYVAGLVWAEVKQLWDQGVKSYIYDMWNILDFTTNSLYIATYTLKLVAYLRVEEEKRLGKATANMPREQWDAYDPTLISEGLFAAANIFSSLKLIYLFTVNPHLGPLQISLGRMVIDILKFLFIALLVCFSYSCGVNQLYWYYAEERNKVCNDCMKTKDAIECKCDRTLANLFEIIQTLYFAIYGLVDIHHFELKEKHEFTQFVGKLMYGTYCGIMIIVLINMLIAMLSSSFQTISNDADTEWKFARSKLWMSYFDEGGTVPAPFNIIPTPKTFYYILLCIKHNMCNCTKKAKHDKWESIRKAIKRMREREEVYQGVIRDLVKRYVMKRQRVTNADGVTEDDINEIKQDISSFRYELLEILKCNDMKVPKLTAAPSHSTGNARQRRRNNRKMYSMDSRSSTETPTEQSFDKFRAQQSLDDDVTTLPFSNDRNSSESGSQQTPDSSGLFRPSFDSKNEKCRWKRTLERIDSKPDKCVESGYSPPTFFLVKSVSGGDTSVFADGTESEFGFSGSSSQLLFNSERKVQFQIRDENFVDNESTEPASGSIDSNDDSQALPVTNKSSKLWRMKFKHNKK